jgi:lipopolysaccharide export system protein LptC
MSPRNITFVGVLIIGALSSWYLTRFNQTAYDDEIPYEPLHRGYYLKKARILGTGENGSLVYEIEAEYAEQLENDQVEFTDVNIRYSPDSDVTWIINADQATLSEGSPQILLRGHVLAINNAASADNDMEIRTQYLELDPERFVAETDQRVQLRIGTRSLTATGMLASLHDDKIELKSNVRGKFVP